MMRAGFKLLHIGLETAVIARLPKIVLAGSHLGFAVDINVPVIGSQGPNSGVESAFG